MRISQASLMKTDDSIAMRFVRQNHSGPAQGGLSRVVGPDRKSDATRRGTHTHLDAHHHVHTIPQLLPVLVALRRRYKINRARTTRTVHNVALRPSSARAVGKSAIQYGLENDGISNHRPLHRLGDFCQPMRRPAPRSSTAELMTHPGSLRRLEIETPAEQLDQQALVQRFSGQL